MDKYKVFPGERFKVLIPGVFSGTAPDLQGEALSIDVLHSFERRLAEGPLWGFFEHNPLVQCPGRILTGRVFYHSRDNEYFLAGVYGYYDAHALPTFADVGVSYEDLTIASGLPDCQLWRPQAVLGICPHEIPIEDFVEGLNPSPSLLLPRLEEHSRKGMDVGAIISLAITTWLATTNPLSKAFLERYGKAAAESSLEFARWLKERLFEQISRLTQKNVLVEFFLHDQDCRVLFVVNSKDPEILSAAFNRLQQEGPRAIAFLEELRHLEPDLLVFGYDSKRQSWLPLHAATRRAGVIAEQPELIAVEKIKGFSIGGSVGFISVGRHGKSIRRA